MEKTTQSAVTNQSSESPSADKPIINIENTAKTNSEIGRSVVTVDTDIEALDVNEKVNHGDSSNIAQANSTEPT